MQDFKIRGKCEGCRKMRWFIRKRKVQFALGLEATSKKLFCNKCAKPLKTLK